MFAVQKPPLGFPASDETQINNLIKKPNLPIQNNLVFWKNKIYKAEKNKLSATVGPQAYSVPERCSRIDFWLRPFSPSSPLFMRCSAPWCLPPAPLHDRALRAFLLAANFSSASQPFNKWECLKRIAVWEQHNGASKISSLKRRRHFLFWACVPCMLKGAFQLGCKIATERSREQERHGVKQRVIQLRSF